MGFTERVFMDHSWDIYRNTNNYDYLSRHPEIERFDMPKTFYFRYLPDRKAIHWAIIKPADGYVNVYFINNIGRVFDKLEFKSVKIARRRLRKCGFDYSTNRYCKETPREPIYIQLSEGKKSASYSKGILFQSVQRDGKNPDKYKKSYEKAWKSWENLCKKLKEKRKKQIKKDIQAKPVVETNSYNFDVLVYFIIMVIIAIILKLLARW